VAATLFWGGWMRFRYDQLMNTGWKRLIPLGMAMVLINAAVGMLRGPFRRTACRTIPWGCLARAALGCLRGPWRAGLPACRVQRLLLGA